MYLEWIQLGYAFAWPQLFFFFLFPPEPWYKPQWPQNSYILSNCKSSIIWTVPISATSMQCTLFLLGYGYSSTGEWNGHGVNGHGLEQDNQDALFLCALHFWRNVESVPKRFCVLNILKPSVNRVLSSKHHFYCLDTKHAFLFFFFFLDAVDLFNNSFVLSCLVCKL